MIPRVDIKGTRTVQKILNAVPGKAHRACRTALTLTGKAIKQAEVEEMRRVFDNPVRYTLNSLRLRPATKAELKAVVWFKEPDRMGDHYLVPQVKGGPRKLKGFERGLGNEQYIPGKFARRTRAGNVSPGQIRQILSVLGKAETSAGFKANLTARSAKRNTKQRDYMVMSSRRGKLYPGIYERVAIKGKGIGGKTRRTLADKSKAYQRGMKKGRYSSVVRARGLRPVLLKGRTGKAITPRLDFYGVAAKEYSKTFEPLFWKTLDKYMRS